MKTPTGTAGAVASLLFSKQGYVRCDCYTITLFGGGGVLRWTSADVAVKYGGPTFVPGPNISDLGVQQKLGTQVSTLDVVIQDDGRTTFNGVPIIKFIKQNGLDAATVKVERVVAPDWATMISTPTGGWVRAWGRVADVHDGGTTTVSLEVNSWTELLDTYMPTDLYSASCQNVVFDSKCTLNRALFAGSGTVSAGSTQSLINTSLTAAADVYTLGSVVFTSGANAGIRRTIKSQDASGHLQLIAPLPTAPAAGDTFTVYPGCDLAQSTCSTKFNNLINFRGQPYIPQPETAV